MVLNEQIEMETAKAYANLARTASTVTRQQVLTMQHERKRPIINYDEDVFEDTE